MFAQLPASVPQAAKCDMIVAHAARDLECGEEVLIFYGNGYPRAWDHGEPAALTKSEAALPRVAFAFLPRDSYKAV